MTYSQSSVAVLNPVANVASVLFIDSAVQDYTQLLNSVRPGVEAHVLNAGEDGVAQITAVLGDRYKNTVPSISIVAHGVPGCLYIGDSELSINTVELYTRWLAAWHVQSIRLYSCHVAEGDVGAAFVSKLHQLTRADVFASSDKVGHSSLGGNWHLDVSSDSFVKSIGLPFYSQIAISWKGVLSVDTDGDGVLDAADRDDDNDGILDTEEGFIPPANILSNGDLDRDSVTGAGRFLGNASVDPTQEFATDVSFSSFSTIGTVDWSEGQYTTFSSSSTSLNQWDGAQIKQSPAGDGFGIFSFPNEEIFQDLTGLVDGETYTFSAYVGVLPVYDSGSITGTPTLVPENFTFGVTGTGDDTVLDGTSLNNGAGYTLGDFPDNASVHNATPTSPQILDPYWEQVTFTFTYDQSAASNPKFFFRTSGNVVVTADALSITAGPGTGRDTDGDGVFDHLDLDSDNDGISDLVESGQDAATVDIDGDGTHNDAGETYVGGVSADAGNGVTPVDSEANPDGVADYLDLDSDNDGIPDAVEAFATSGYTTSADGNVSDEDSDGDGAIDRFDLRAGHGGSFTSPINTDGALPGGDAVADYLDTDSDRDGTPDSVESGLTPGVDNNGDGIGDGINASYLDPDGDINNPSGSLNINGAVDPSHTTEVDYRNNPPILSTVVTDVESTTDTTPVEITFAEIAAQGNEADIDGTVAGFVVQSVTSGTLLMGTDAASATPFAAGINDTVDATRKAYWTPDAGAGDSTNAFTVVAVDNNGSLSSQTVEVPVFVQSTPVLSDTTDPGTVLEMLDASAQNLAPLSGSFSVADNNVGEAIVPSVVGSPTVELNGNTYTLPPGAVDLIANDAFSLSGSVSTGGSTDISYVYDPGSVALDFLGENDLLTLTYAVKVNDGTADSNLQDVTISILGTVDAPVASDGTLVTDEETAVPLAIVPTATDIDGIIDGNGFELVSNVAEGTLVFNPNGSYSFDPGNDFQDLGVGDSRDVSFTYTAKDDDGAVSDPATITITVTGTNDGPVLSDTTDPSPVVELLDASAQDLDAIAGTFDVADADSGDTLTASVTGAPVVLLDGSAFTLPSGAAALIDSAAFSLTDGISNGGTASVGYTYDPGAVDLDFLSEGQSLTITYGVTVSDGTESTAPQDVTITITGTNDAPVVTADTQSVNEDAVLTSAVPTAFDAENGVVANSYALASPVSEGSLVFNDDGSYTFTPGPDFQGLREFESRDATFAYTVLDENGAISDPATVTITVTGSNDGLTLSDTTDPAPVDELLDASAQDLSEIASTFSIVDLDNGDPLTPSVVGAPTVTLNGSTFALPATATSLIDSGAFTLSGATSNGGTTDIGYSYDPGAADLDFLQVGDSLQLTYMVEVDDGSGNSMMQDVVITLNGTNDAPQLSDPLDPAAIDEMVDAAAQDIAVAGTFDVNDADVGDAIAPTVIGQPTVELNGSAYTLPAGAEELIAAGAFSLSGTTSNGGNTSIGYSYDPGAVDLDFLKGSDRLTITYAVKVNDGTADSVTQDVTITLNGTNDAPVAYDDANTTDEESAIALGIVPNATDADGIVNANAFSLVDDVAEGTLIFNNNGGYSFDPGNDFQDLGAGDTREVFFTYTAVDNEGAVSEPATVTITVTGVNDGPVLIDTTDPTAIAELVDASAQDIAVSGTFAVEDADVDDVITPSVVGSPTVALDGAAFTLPAGAAALLDAGAFNLTGTTSNGGSTSIGYSYDPGAVDLDFLAAGERLTLTYAVQVNDGSSDSAVQNVTITIEGTNDIPVAFADAQSLSEDGVLNGSVPTATDVDSNIDADGYVLQTSVAEGSLTFNPDGSYVFDPGTDFQDLKPMESRDVSFTYTATDDDDGGISEPVTVTLTVTGSNDGPVLSDTTDPAAVLELLDASAQDLDAIAGTFTVNDPDVGEALTASVVGSPVVQLNGSAYTLPSGAESLIDSAAFSLTDSVSNGGDTTVGYTYDPGAANLDFLPEGENLTITYSVEVSDGTSTSEIQDVTITLTGTNDLPVVTGDAQSIDEDSILSATVPTATDVDGEVALNGYALATGVTEGTLSFNTDGSYSFDPGADFQDLKPTESRDVTFTYTATDNNGAASAPETVVITVTGTNDVPLVTNDSQLVDEDTVLSGSVPAATDVDGTIANYTLLSNVTSGSLSFNPADGSYSFDPGADFQDLKPAESRDVTFTYSATDDNGDESAPATVTITATGTNDGPVLSDTTDPAAISELVDASAQDLDAIAGTFTVTDLDAGDVLTPSVEGQPVVELNGTPYVLPAGAQSLIDSGAFALSGATSNGGDTDIGYSYDPSAADLDFLKEGESLTLTYTVKVNDGTADSMTQDVVITLLGTNDLPVASAASETIDEDAVLTGVVPPATDLDGVVDANGYILVEGVNEGTLTFNNDGSYTFDPGDAFQDLKPTESRQVSFTYTATDDDSGVSEPATVTIEVTGSNDGPVLTDTVDPSAIDELEDASVQDIAVTGAFSVSDADVGDAIAPTIVGQPTVELNGAAYTLPEGAADLIAAGAFNLTGTTSTGGATAIDYSYDPSAVDLDFLSVGDSLTITYGVQVSDGTANSLVQDVTITIAGTNDIPVVSGDTQTTDEEAPILLGVVPVATDVDGIINGNAYSLVTDVAEGVLTFNNNGSYSFDPADAFEDLDVGETREVFFTYTATDNDSGISEPATITITVTGTNDAPVAVDATSTTDEDTLIDGSVPVPTDIDGTIDPAGYSLVSDVAEGTLTFNPDGTYSFDPGLDFQDLGPNDSRDVTFTYTATDNNGTASAPATVTIAVDGINDVPQASDDTPSTDEDTVFMGSVPMPSDVDGTIEPNGYLLVDPVAEGTLTFNPDGSYSFDPGDAFQDLKPTETRDVTFTYTATDNDGGVSEPATVTITVTGDNDAVVLNDTVDPVAVDELLDASAQDLGAIAGTFSVEDADVGDTLTPAVVGAPVVELNGATFVLPTGAEELIANGVFSLTGNTSDGGAVDIGYSYDPGAVDLDWLAAGDRLTLTYAVNVSDGTNTSASQNVTIAINGTNDIPVVSADSQSIDEDNILTATVPTATDIDGTVVADGYTLVDSVSEGTLSFNADGSYSFDPGAGFQDLSNGDSRDVTFTYTATDNSGDISAPETVTITVMGTNDAPVAINAAAATDEDTLFSSNVPMPTDVDGTIAPDSYALVTPVSEGSLTFNPDGSYSFDPSADFQDLGDGDSRDVTFTYTATDNEGSVSEPATVTITVNGTNDAPVAVEGTVTTDEDTQILLGVVPTTTDVDGTVDANGYTLVDTVTEGTLTFNDNGGYSFDPGADFQDLGPNDSRSVSFTYTAIDNDGAVSEPATITIEVTGTNDVPIAQPATDSTDEDTVLVDAMVPMATDIDSTIDPDGYVLASGAAEGELTFNPDGSYSFDPGDAFQNLGPNDSRNVTFTYTATDLDGDISAPETVTITVNGTNDRPTLSAFDAPVGSTLEDTSVEVSFSDLIARGNEGDVDGTVDGFVVQAVTSGTLLIGTDESTATPFAAGVNDVIDANNRAFWQPASDMSGEGLSAFSVLAIDNEGLMSGGPVAVTFDVQPVADAPVVVATAATGTENTAIALDLSVTSGDSDGSETLTTELSDIPVGATLSDGVNVFTAGEGTTSVDISTWNLDALTVRPPANSDADFALTVSATSADGSDTEAIARTLEVTVTPELELSGSGGSDVITGDDGDNIINGLSDNDTIDGGGGNDIVNGGSDVDVLLGGTGDDVLNGGSSNDNIEAGTGNDIVNAGSGNDSVVGGDGNDILNGGSGADTLYGNDGRDLLTGGSDDDLLFGGADRDLLRGGSGDDLLFGGAGQDVLSGGEGSDRFAYEQIGDFGDLIQDFEIVRDRIDLSGIYNGDATLGSTVRAQQVGAHAAVLAETDAGTQQVALLLDVNASTLDNSNFVF